MTRPLPSIEAAMAALREHVPATVSMRENYTLDRLREFLTGIGNPQDSLRVVHVAGTSGKTSTAYFTRALLQEAGQRTGLTISPHIASVTERVQIGGEPLPDGRFLRYLERFLEIVGASAVPLTYFEVLVAFAQWVFAQEEVDYAVVETGLGGLLDGTNTVSRADKVCVITDLGLDHTEVLGAAIEQIAAQKAGIIQPGNKVFLLHQDIAAMRVVSAEADRQGATLRIVTPQEDGATASLPPFQRRNFAIARACCDYLAQRDGLPPLPPDAVARAMSLQPPGRFEAYPLGDRVLILDGAHNPQKMAALVEALHASGARSAAVLASLVAAPRDKLTATFGALKPVTSHLIAGEFSVIQDLAKQSPPAAQVAWHARSAGIDSVEAIEDLTAAFAALLRRQEPVLVVTGSLYLVSQVRPLARAAALARAAGGERRRAGTRQAPRSTPG